MRVIKNNWIKRVIAAGMATSMVMTTTLPTLAESTVGESYHSQEISDDNSLSENTAPLSENTESGIQTYNIDSAETNGQNDQTEDIAEEPSKEEVQLSLKLLAEEDADTTKPSLDLENAVELSAQLNIVDNDENIIEVHNGEGLILLSNVKPEDYKDKTIKLITTTGWDTTQPAKVGDTSYNFLGLGDDTNPYEGNLALDEKTAATNYSITTSKSLFNALSTKATLGKLPFSVTEKSSTSKPLLAENLKKDADQTSLKCNIVLRDLNSGTISDATIGGVIGTMEENTSAEISFKNQFQSDLTVRGTSHTGLFCNTMKSGASLSVTLTNDSNAGKIEVQAIAANADAGGFVGRMEENSSLTVDGTSVGKVGSTSGNAGGFVGSAVDATIQLKENGDDTDINQFTFSDSLTLSAASDKAAGGLIGDCTITKTKDESSGYSYDLSKIQFQNITIFSGKNVGGLFGVLTNTSTTGTTVSVAGNSSDTISTAVSGDVTNFGGLIGSYTASNMESSLSIKGEENEAINVTSTGGVNVSASYGGVIGEISNNSYIEIENVSVTTADMKNDTTANFGGLVGKVNDGLLNVGSVTLTTASSGNNNFYDISKDADDIDGHGGLVGHLVKGVLRLHGTTNLSGQKITTAYHHVGQIVGYNENGLVYALGDGNGLSESGEGWSLTRYSGTDRSGSDIGNWGAVVRLGGNLSERDNGVFTFNGTAHTVTVNNGDSSAIKDANDFAAYALAFDISSAYKDQGEAKTALKFNSTVDATQKQAVTLTGDVNLTGTGIIGIGKDDNWDTRFKGTFDGNNNTVTLDIGSIYGSVGDLKAESNTNAAGQLYAKRNSSRDAHYGLALIPFAKEATIQNVTIKGTVNGKVPKNVSQVNADNDTDRKYPAFVSAVIGAASGETTFKNVTVNASVSVSEEKDAQKLYVWQSGFLGRYDDKGSTLIFQKCTWGSDASLKDERTTDNHRIGGFAAEVMGGCTVTVEDCTLSGSITSSSDKNAYVGGLIAVSRGESETSNNKFTSNPSKITLSELRVKGEKITAEEATVASGGLLGYWWQDTDVTFTKDTDTESNGVTVSGASLTANTAQFGGLVYFATGYWNATAKDSIVFAMGDNNTANRFSGKSDEKAPSGLLVGKGFIMKTVRKDNLDIETVPYALYLEVGTYGTAKDAAYKFAEKSVTLNINGSDYFDELVGETQYDAARDLNAVVSIAVRDESGNTAIKFDQNVNNTYINQTGTNYKNPKTRYYYNLDSCRKNKGVEFKQVTDAESLVLWSVSQYATDCLKKYFWKSVADAATEDAKKGTETPVGVTISGDIDLTGYSYYPVTPLGSVTLGSNTTTKLTFDNENIENVEKTNQNKQPSDSEHQHYLMHHGLLYNTSYSVNVNNVSFSGTVGKATDETTESTYNSGALIFGTAAGDPTKTPLEINLSNVTLSGIRVTDIKKESVTYAPLLINKIDSVVKLTVDTLSTGEGYTVTDSDSNETTYYAATSLIGNVGHKTATKLTLTFSNIALDGRVEKTPSLSETVSNNGEVEVNYHTTHTIFTRATLLEKFQYVPAEGSGAYNFNSTDTMVTYGVELTNTGTTGRNPDKQYEYYDSGYISDEKNAEKTENYVKNRYKGSNFIRYVYMQENSSENLFELDINQRATGLLEGCGTYGDPYIIKNGEQLISLADYFQSPETVSDFRVVFNSKVFKEQKQTASGYHLQGNATTDATGSDNIYTWENGAWQSEDNVAQNSDFTNIATKYLLNAYYMISNDIEIKSDKFAGLGTLEKPFSGVIVGQNQDIVKISCTGTRLGFGGLITYSRGSVVKNLKLDYSSANLTMSNSQYPGLENNYPFFGGVVGYCMGGDTVIDQVSMKFTGAQVNFTDTCDYLIPAGGYIGLVGGAKETKEANFYEKKGGGVVFRNMKSTTNDFSAVCMEAEQQNQTVNDDGKTTTDGGKYFYRNPYVGRVLDGYACSETDELNNTDKNYTIPTLTVGKSDLNVTEENGVYNVGISSAQGLWLLSAIVNSGAGAMDSTGQYSDVDNQTIDAYQLGKPRTASYEGIGEVAGNEVADELSDEIYWGGNISTKGSDDAKNRVSYLVKNYTTNNAAAHLTGKSATAATNNPVTLNFFSDGTIDMTAYANGFRGIGSSYGYNYGGWNVNYSIPKVYRRNLLIQSINAEKSTDTIIKLNMNQNDYNAEYQNGLWRNQGAGLFVAFHFTNGCTVNHLKISGTVKVGIFNETLTYLNKSTYEDQNKTKIETDVGVGGFAARTANSWGKVTFTNFHLENLSIYGGTSAGGCIGYADYKREQKNTDQMIIFGKSESDGYQPWSINNVTVKQWVNNNGNAGGLIGWFESGRMLSVVGYGDDTANNITDLTVTTIANTSSSSVGGAGGLVGSLDFGSMSIQGVHAKNVNISGENLRDLGGFIGGGRQGGTIEIGRSILDTITIDSNTGENNNGGVGGVIGDQEKELTISDVTIKNESKITGFRFVGGFVGRSAAKITIQNCAQENAKIAASWNHAGGFIGSKNANNTVVLKNCSESNVNILAANDAGGLIGNVNNSSDINMSNIDVSGMRVVTKNKANCAGILVGYAYNKKVYGYNILVSDSKAGYSSSSPQVENLKNETLQKATSTNGLWIGEGTTDGVVNLVAVSAKGDVYPQIDIGIKSKATVSIVYADKTADKTYTPTSTDKPYASANPWLDVNPKSAVSLADGTVMTGNAVGTGVANTILTELNSTSNTPTDYYWNLLDGTKEEVVKLLSDTNDAYLTTYQAEEKTTTTVSADVDFPILVVNNTAEVDTVLWDYIAAMTNVADADTAKGQVNGTVQATTYKWDSNTTKFIVQKTPSLSVNAKNKISITPNAYDNQISQFTLLKVSYQNPTDSKAPDFYLYIPVLVKKVLYISFKTRFLSGTDYCVSDYPMTDTSTSHYATAGFDEPLTAYMEYSYEKDTDWQSMLDNGENLLWYYDKVLDLAKGSTAETGSKLLPAGTQLTLVDRQTLQYYTYTTTGNEDFHNFNLSGMTAPDGETTFKPVNICDLLELTVSEPIEEKDQVDGTTYYVIETNATKATVQVGDIYYRKAQDTDEGDKYTITVAASTMSKAQSESYYLTIQIPTTSGYSVVNNRLNYGTISRKEGTLPASITSDSNTSGSSYVVYNGVEQTFTISTNRIHNGSTMGDTIMENGDSIKITLQSKLKLTEAGKGRFNTLGPDEFYHQFDISLKQYLKNVAEYDIIGTENIVYQYTVAGNGLNKTFNGTIQNMAGEETLTIPYGNKALKQALNNADSDATAVTITAEITLTYVQSDHFPIRNISDSSDSSGISAIAVSRIANTKNQLPIASEGNKTTKEDASRYYTVNPSKASLTYSTVDGAGIGDTTQQLGINPSDEINNLSNMIYTRADYDYSSVDATVLSNASKIRYTMELFQKNVSGSYSESNPLEIGSYLQNTNKDGVNPTSNSTLTYQWEEQFTASDVKHEFSRIRFAPLTGSEFEEKGYTYANYKVRLSVVLLDGNGNELDGTKCSDYIIYTNARIYQEILSDSGQ